MVFTILYCFKHTDQHLTAASLRKIREKGGSTTRKLVGHSGPVYSVAFDPIGGSAAPPKYLLSCSADATTRLWSLDTMTNVVAYRGHQNPVWDVQWSPMGIYFATASRDRTARLWSTDRSNALRIYAGHLSDVDVRFLILLIIFAPVSCLFFFFGSVYDSIPTRCTLRQGPATEQHVSGMYNEGTVCESSSDTRTLFQQWHLVQMVKHWRQLVCLFLPLPKL